MCRVCNGHFPTKQEYDHLRNQAKTLLDKWSKRGDAATNQAFIPEVVRLDNIRLSTGAVWGNPGYLGKPIQLIFNNSDANKGLLLYVIGIWMNYQKKTETVWTTYLEEADNWILGKQTTPPREKMPNLANHLNKSKNVATDCGSIANWFADAIVAIASSAHGMRPGNIYRMASYILLQLLDAASRNWDDYLKLEDGQCALLGRWKRLWLLLRSLRRDNSLVRCLFERALGGANNGHKALGYWYNDSYFDPRECQLPVDGWVIENWIQLMNGSAFSSRKELKEFAEGVRPRVVAQHAKKLAVQHDISPSVFDVLFLAREL